MSSLLACSTLMALAAASLHVESTAINSTIWRPHADEQLHIRHTSNKTESTQFSWCHFIISFSIKQKVNNIRQISSHGGWLHYFPSHNRQPSASKMWLKLHYHDTKRPQGDEDGCCVTTMVSSSQIWTYNITAQRPIDWSCILSINIFHLFHLLTSTHSVSHRVATLDIILFIFSSSSNQPSSPHHTHRSVSSWGSEVEYWLSSVERAPVGHKHHTHKSHSCYLERVLRSIPASFFVISPDEVRDWHLSDMISAHMAIERTLDVEGRWCKKPEWLIWRRQRARRETGLIRE